MEHSPTISLILVHSPTLSLILVHSPTLSLIPHGTQCPTLSLIPHGSQFHAVPTLTLSLVPWSLSAFHTFRVKLGSYLEEIVV